MSIFPSISRMPSLTRSIKFSTLIQENRSGAHTRKRQRTYPLRSFQIKNDGLNYSDMVTLYQFFIARGGMYEAFVIFDDNDEYSYVKEYVGTGDASTTVFDLPSKSGTSRTFYVDDVAQVEGVNLTFTEGGGADGEDRATFGSAPSNGARITYSFTGQLKVRCIFGIDTLSFDEFYTLFHSVGIPIRGLLNT